MKTDLRLAAFYGLTIFLSAFLLFQVQPMIGKMILPWFGGSASVWTTCMLFFQMVLLLGYFYSHWVVRFLSPARQSLLHGALLVISLLVLPVSPSADWKPAGADNPTLHILGLLGVSIGLPYFVLSTTGPLVQAWFARERSGHLPYRLFALSNFGSMLALLSFPVLIEPVLQTRVQSWLWSGLYAVFVLVCGLLAWRGRRGIAITVQSDVMAAAQSLGQKLLWAALAACPSILMVADTSFMTTNIAPIPMLWVGPLALYLLSFILCFERHGSYRRAIFLPLLVVSLGALAWLPTLGIDEIPLRWSVAINLSAFFVACMVCHGELARLQPHPSQLTSYYLMLAVGGAIGGFFVGVIAPYLFDSYYELSIGIVLTGAVAAIAVIAHTSFSAPRWRYAATLASVLLLGSIGLLRFNDHVAELSGADATVRNFYGTLQVYTSQARGTRSMLHGQIIHGRQYLAPELQDRPTTYYTAEGGAGRALRTKAERSSGDGLRVGVIGLGVGTLAAYGRTGDTFRFYEIDPLVIDIAHKHFSYLSRGKAQTDIVLGDARLQLEAEPDQRFDVLVVDAFSGDSVPVHLLTEEAFAQYQRHLKPDGVLAVHITNRFLNLQPVIKSAADRLGKAVRVVDTESDSAHMIFRSRWMLLSADPGFFAHPNLAGATEAAAVSNFRPWRDDYSSILSILM